MISMFKLFLGLAAALSITTIAHAQTADPNRLFADSRLVVRDRFSDEIVGKGPDLVFIPGLASSRATWKATAERLRGKHRLHLIQVAGFSGEPARANATGDVLIPTAEAIDAYLVEQMLTPATVVGHSLGGTTILYLAEKHPTHLKKLLIVDALPFYSVLMLGPSATVESIQPMAAKIRASMLAASGPPDPQAIKAQMAMMASSDTHRSTIATWSLASERSVVARAMYEDMTLDLRPGVGAITTPTTLLFPDYGATGRPVAITEGLYRSAYAAAKAVKLVRVDKSVHFIMLDQPQVFADALDAFLANP